MKVLNEQFFVAARIVLSTVLTLDSGYCACAQEELAAMESDAPLTHEVQEPRPGYGTRLASGYGRLVINRTIRFGVAALDHEDPRFSYSNQAGFWRRFRYASIH